jgi:hypothetical protein
MDTDICQRRGCKHDADSHLNGTGACGWCPCAELIAPEPAERAEPDPAAAVLDQLGALWSPDFAAYASGELDVSQVRCVLCLQRPCACPPFGTPEYFALIDQRHGRGTR